MRKFTITLLSFLLFTAGFTSAQVADELSAPFVVSNVQVWQEDGSFIDQHLIVLGKEDLGYELGCSDCHAFHFEDDDADGPDLTGYGSRECDDGRG